MSSSCSATEWLLAVAVSLGWTVTTWCNADLIPARPQTNESGHATGATLVTYPAPEGAALSDEYSVSVNGRPVDVYLAPVYEPSFIFSGRPFGGPYSFAYFDMAEPVEVRVRTEKPLDRVRILPESRGIQPVVEGDTLSFKVAEPCRLSVEPDAKSGPLLLFANPIEVNPPTPEDPGVKYFGPGIYKPGEILLGTGETLYIAGGAVVKGGVLARGSNIRITGRGILDGLDWERFKGPTSNLICLDRCNYVRIDGIILKDSWTWTLVIRGSKNVRISNVKICSSRCANNDGIGTVNSQRVRIEDCFVRSEDDCITAKGMGWPDRDPDLDGMPVEYLYVARCVLWTDRAHIWRLGCESWAEGTRNLSFKDIDVLHWDGPWVATVQPAEDMTMENVQFEDIRVNGEGQTRLIEIYPAPTEWVQRKNTPGMLRNVLLKDFIVSGERQGPLGLIRVWGCDAEHSVEDVTFDNVLRYGHPVGANSPEVEVNEYTKGITFK